MKKIYHSRAAANGMSLLWVVSFVILTGCAFKVELTSQKTALENQILGEYQKIDDDIILISTVRGKGKAEKIIPAEFARQNQRFNLDDIDELKRDQILGETRSGKLAILPGTLIPLSIKKTTDFSFKLKLARSLLIEENSDRHVIWLQTIKANKSMKINDMPEVQKSYALQVIKEMNPGYWYQSAAGKWIQKQQIER